MHVVVVGGGWAGLAGLYEQEAARLAVDPSLPESLRSGEAAWWWARAARVYRASNNWDPNRIWRSSVSTRPEEGVYNTFSSPDV